MTIGRGWQVRRVTTADELNRWIRRELHVPKVCYFQGDLAQFRKSAAKEILQIETEIDRAKPTKPVHPRMRFRLEELRRDVELAQEAQRQAEAGNVHLSQARQTDGTVEYIATRLTRRSTAED